MKTITITKNDFKSVDAKLCLNSLQFIGLEAAGISVVNKSLLFGGKRPFHTSETPVAWKAPLYIGQGGLRNNNVSANAKRLFKYKVLPALSEINSEIEMIHGGTLDLHFREGIFQELKLTIK